MNGIIAINKTLSPEDKKEFLNFLKRKNRRGDTKNIKLYKLIDQGNTELLDVQLYGKPSRNSFHALCKRLQDNLIEFVAEKSFSGETSEELQIMKQLLASRIFFEHKQFKIAFKTLEKAEKEALHLDLYSILTEIYHTKIQYGHLHPNDTFKEIVAKAKKNQELQQRELQLNMAYASIKNQISKGNLKIENIIEDTFNDFGIKIDNALTYKSLFQLLQLLTTSAKLKSDYNKVLPIARSIYNTVRKKKSLAEKHLYYHIEILNLMSVVSFRNKDFENSLNFAHMMEIEMYKQGGKYYHRFSTDLVLLKALNLNFTRQAAEAISLIHNFPKPSLEMILAHIMCLIQQEDFNTAWKEFRKLHHSDSYYEKRAGLIWVIQKNIMELLLLMELDKLDLVLSRLNSFKRVQFPKLRILKEDRAIRFVELVSFYYEDPKAVTSREFKEKVEDSFEWKEAKEEDIFVMSFYAWLKSKMEQRPLYEVTQALVQME